MQQQKKCVRSFLSGFFPGAVRFLALVLAVVLSAGVASAQTLAYVATGNNTVLVYDASTHALVATVPVGFAPANIAATPDQAFVYVTNRGSADVSVIATASNTVVATVPVGSSPRGVAVTPDGAFVYVANDLSASVSVIATASNTVVATIPVGLSPRGVAVSPDGTSVYVANGFGSTVSVIATGTNTVTTDIPIASPQDVEITPTGRLDMWPEGTPQTFRCSARPATRSWPPCQGAARPILPSLPMELSLMS
jgi:YVTN family beta-propeller protein